MNKFLKYLIGIVIILVVIAIVNNTKNRSMPDDWKGVKLYSMVDGRDWIIINNDNTFTLHIFIPNADETHEWQGKVENMKLVTTQPLNYQGRNDFKPTEIDPKIEMMDIAGKFLRINFKYFSTISGKYEIDGKNFTRENVTPY